MSGGEERFSRSQLLLGAAGMARLRRSQVVICGLGGVGSYVAEAVARCGLGAILLVDFDVVAISNINRQLCALTSTVGQSKAQVVAERIRQIDPECRVEIRRQFIDADNAAQVVGGFKADYLADAIDYVPGKLALIHYALEHDIRLISAMGAGRRLDPSQLRVADISRSRTCPLARTIRRQLRDSGVTSGVTVVYSEENPAPQEQAAAEEGRAPLGSLSFVTASMGLLMASVIIRQLAGEEG